MGVPQGKESRNFYRCAFHRFAEAKVLYDADYTTGAVYLAGYAIECILKSLVLATIPHQKRKETLEAFRGNRGHNFEWLRYIYRLNGGAKFPPDLARNFTLVNDWSTELRYAPYNVRADEADAFLKAAESILQWADGRL